MAPQHTREAGAVAVLRRRSMPTTKCGQSTSGLRSSRTSGSSQACHQYLWQTRRTHSKAVDCMTYGHAWSTDSTHVRTHSSALAMQSGGDLGFCLTEHTLVWKLPGTSLLTW